MSSTGSDEREAASWAEETLPLAVRRQLLERQLEELGFRKAAGGGHAAARHEGAPSSAGGHPQAGADDCGHGD